MWYLLVYNYNHGFKYFFNTLAYLQEERHLLLTFADDYKAYKAQTPRYLLL